MNASSEASHRTNVGRKDGWSRPPRHPRGSTRERAVPNYRKIDRDPRWHRWLASLDPLLGCPRQQLLNQAVASGDASRISAFFRGFLSEAGGAQASSAPPRRATRSSDGPIYTRAQIAKLYDQHRRGAYLGREAEWQRQDLIAAGREGRIIGGGAREAVASN